MGVGEFGERLEEPRMGWLRNKTLFLAPSFYSVGNCAEEIFWGLNHASVTKQPVELIAPQRWTQWLGYRICNEELFRVLPTEKGELKVFQRPTVQFFFNCLFVIKRALNKALLGVFGLGLGEKWDFLQTGKNQYWPCPKNPDGSLGFYKKLAVIRKIHRPVSLTVSDKVLQACAKKLARLTFDSHKPWVCLHVRESGFHGDHHKRNYRNSRIHNYQEAIGVLTKKYTVFRMGDRSMEKANFQCEGFVDYAHSRYKSPAMDLFLVQKCAFYVGMQSGLLDAAFMFGRPVLILNGYEWYYSNPLKSCDRLLLQETLLPGASCPLKFRERLELPFFYTDPAVQIPASRLIFRENSPEQLGQAVERFAWEHSRSFRRTEDRGMKTRRSQFEKRSGVFNREVLPDLLTSRDPFRSRNAARYLMRNLACRGQFYTT